MFCVPFGYFLYKRQVKAKLVWRLALMLALGGTQGALGWWMVKSGLERKPEYQSRPRVSVYRLLMHLSMGVGIYGMLLWNSLTLLRKPQEQLLRVE